MGQAAEEGIIALPPFPPSVRFPGPGYTSVTIPVTSLLNLVLPFRPLSSLSLSHPFQSNPTITSHSLVLYHSVIHYAQTPPPFGWSIDPIHAHTSNRDPRSINFDQNPVHAPLPIYPSFILMRPEPALPLRYLRG